MPVGDPGLEQFRRAIITVRNHMIVAGLAPLMLMREEIVTNDDFVDRGGVDTITRDHFLVLLHKCDVMRRHCTYNPSPESLSEVISKAINTELALEIGENPFGGDDIQGMSNGLLDIPWALDGTDVNIPLNSKLVLKSHNARVLLGAVDSAIVTWTRINSRDRSRFITQGDSTRIYGCYQQIFGFLMVFQGDLNRTDVANVLPSDEPLGPADSANIVGAGSGNG